MNQLKVTRSAVLGVTYPVETVICVVPGVVPDTFVLVILVVLSIGGI